MKKKLIFKNNNLITKYNVVLINNNNLLQALIEKEIKNKTILNKNIFLFLLLPYFFKMKKIKISLKELKELAKNPNKKSSILIQKEVLEQDVSLKLFSFLKKNKKFLLLSNTLSYLNFFKHKKKNFIKFKKILLNLNFFWFNIFNNPIIKSIINLFSRNGNTEKAELFLFNLAHEIKKEFNIHLITQLLVLINLNRPYIGIKEKKLGRRIISKPVELSLKMQFFLPIQWFFFHVKKAEKKNIACYNLLIDTQNKTGFIFSKIKELHEKAYFNRNYIYSKF